MILLIGSLVLGLFNVSIQALALRNHRRLAAWALLLVQIPWTYYDVITRQYGFLILSVLSSAVAITTIRRVRQ